MKVLEKLVIRFVPTPLSPEETKRIAERTRSSLEGIPAVYRLPIFFYLRVFSLFPFRIASTFPGWGALSKLLRTLIHLNSEHRETSRAH